jgi:hypothetical protein
LPSSLSIGRKFGHREPQGSRYPLGLDRCASEKSEPAPEGESIIFVRATAANHNSHLLGQQHHRMRATALLSADILIAPHQTGGCYSRSPHATGSDRSSAMGSARIRARGDRSGASGTPGTRVAGSLVAVVSARQWALSRLQQRSRRGRWKSPRRECYDPRFQLLPRPTV